MSNRTFTALEIDILSKNPYVKKVTSKGITYSDEFKEIFINERENYKPATQIFTEYGFDIDIIGRRRVKCAAERWTNAYKRNGLEGLKDNRKGNSGRPSEKELSIEEKYKKLMVQTELLKAENELLKKLHALERGVKIQL